MSHISQVLWNPELVPIYRLQALRSTLFMNDMHFKTVYEQFNVQVHRKNVTNSPTTYKGSSGSIEYKVGSSP